MSAFVLSKIDIDVLVQLAMFGPQGAERWQAYTDDPDALGTMLWRQNYEAAADPDEDPPLPEYRFEPLPFAVTAVEGLKQCDCYVYQTADDDDAWRAGPASHVIARLHRDLVDWVPGLDEAPWGWESGDVTARMGRGGAPRWPVPAAPEPAPEDPLVAEVPAALRAVGLDVTRTDVPGLGGPGRSPEFDAPDPRHTLAHWLLRIPGIQPVPFLDIQLFDGEEAARQMYRAMREDLERNTPHFDHRLVRTGRSVVHYLRAPDTEAPAKLLDALTALGPPDERWSTGDPPVA